MNKLFNGIVDIPVATPVTRTLGSDPVPLLIFTYFTQSVLGGFPCCNNSSSCKS